MATYEEYWAKQAAPTVYTGSNDDLQREKRMANWQRSYKLPSMIGDAVQSAMLNNPYDRSAALRAELAQQSAGSLNLPWRTKEALAAELFKASPIDATSGDGAAPGQRISSPNPRTATQSAGPVAARGVVNGRELAVPTAGNYVNGAFNAEMNRLGMGDMGVSNTPSWQEYQQAVYDNQPSSLAMTDRENQRRSSERIAEIQSRGRVDAAAMKGGGKAGKDATLEAYKKRLGMDQKEEAQQINELHSAYERFIRSGGDEAMTFDEFALRDPVARDIRAKYAQLGEVNVRGKRSNQMAKENLLRGNMTDGARAEDLTQKMLGEKSWGSEQALTPVKSDAQSKVSQSIQQAKANGASDEQIIAAAQQSGLSREEMTMVQAELEGKKIRRAQYGAPAKPKAKAAMKPDAPTGRARGGDGVAKMGADGRAYDSNWGIPQGTAVDESGNSQWVQEQPSIIDELIRRIQSPPRPYYNPILPTRYAGLDA